MRLPAIPGKAFAIVGVPRSGNTSFLAQCRAARVQAGAPPESQLLLLLEDERLAGMTAAGAAYPDAALTLVTLDSSPPRRPLPERVVWAPAARWLMEPDRQIA